jgi:hypothetical protein
MNSGSSASDVVRCPLYRGKGDFTVEFCDNLVGGVPACVADEFYVTPNDQDPEEVKAWLYGPSEVERARMDFGREKCKHFILSEATVAELAFEGVYYCACRRRRELL